MNIRLFIKLITIISIVESAKVSTETSTVDLILTPKSPEISICVNITPTFVSSRDGSVHTLECFAQICNDSMDALFDEPLFDWNSQFGHILIANGTCDYSGRKCWNSIDIDIDYYTDEMLDNGVNEMQFTCYVSDYFGSDLNKNYQFVSANDVSYLKLFPGKHLNEDCIGDLECGTNMYCQKTKPPVNKCQCMSDFLTGVQYVSVVDRNYTEVICVPPVLMNETCVYDKQCQAFDFNTVCQSGICVCGLKTEFIDNKCQKTAETSDTTIIWWIFTDYDSSADTHRFMSMRKITYTLIILSVVLPILLILISLLILCYRRMNRMKQRQNLFSTRFPAPRLQIDDLCDMKKGKSEDKYDLVKNDSLEKSLA